jgi:hypothetical protein
MCLRLLAYRDIDERESVPARGGCQPIVERHDLQRRRPPFCGDEGRGQLQGAGCAKGMNAQKPDSRLAQRVVRVDLVPAPRQLSEPLERLNGPSASRCASRSRRATADAHSMASSLTLTLTLTSI